MFRTSLPIDPLLPEVVASLRQTPCLVIEAPPGAGKTTRIPPALLLGDPSISGEIVVLQPRRLPARLAAHRVAEELSEPLGQRVGYTVRFEDVSGPSTRIRFLTEGLLLRRMLSDPALSGASVVVMDEFHERHVASDLSLALLRRLQQSTRPDLRIIAMSATLDGDPIREFLGDCPCLRSEGRAFPVEVEYQPSREDRALPDQVVSAVKAFARDGLPGNLLVFVPGAGEIRRVLEGLREHSEQKGYDLFPLHGDLSPNEQRKAVEPSQRSKIVVSTNVAESSVTIPGVVAVIDTGLARIASLSPFSGLPRLALGRISQASAIQRAGRAGRTCPGKAIRLYSRQDFESLKSHDVPEIQRLDLAETLLTLSALGITDVDRFAWFDPPSAASLDAAKTLLRRLSAVDRHGGLTDIGRKMARFPAHPRLARLMVEGQRLGVFPQSTALAAILSEGDISEKSKVRFGNQAFGHDSFESADLLERLERFQQARAARFEPRQTRSLGLDPRAVEGVDRARRQFQGCGPAVAGQGPSSPVEVDRCLAMSTMTAFPDRLMRRRSDDGTEAILATGGAVSVGPLPPEALLVAVDAEERGGIGKGAKKLCVRLSVGIEADWILDVIPNELSEDTSLEWNRTTFRVERVSRLRCGAIVLDESRNTAPPSVEASRILSEQARSSNYMESGETGGSISSLQVKLEVLRTALPEASIPSMDEAAVHRIVSQACEDLVSLAELRATPVIERILASFEPSVAGLLRREVPDFVTLPGGRRVPVQYEVGKPPWIESRLQDFFGMGAGPVICRGRVPLTLHLLAPNKRAVQVTSDLAGFWKRHYPEIRRELGRRYPRHPWPEDGATAQPPEPRPPRR